MSRGARLGSGWVNRLWFALECCDNHAMRQLIAHGVDINHVFKQQAHQRHGQTPLIIAVSKNCREIVTQLLQAGADLNHEDLWGETALFVAIRRGKLPMVRHLVDAGCLVDHQNQRGETALSVAVQCGRRDLVEYLLNVGASVDTVDNTGSTPLLVALQLLWESLAGTGRTTRRRAPSTMRTIILRLIPASTCLDLAHPIKGSALRLALALEISHSPQDLQLSTLLLQHGAMPDRLFFLRFGGLNAATTPMGSAFFTAEFFQLALCAGACLQREKTWLLTVLQEMPGELQPHAPLFQDLLRDAMQPLPLRTLAIIAIRRQLTRPLWTSIDTLPLPTAMKNSLKLKSGS